MKKRKVENLGKRESKCIKNEFLVPIYKIFFPKISTFGKQWENLAKSFNFAGMNFRRWLISKAFVDDIFLKIFVDINYKSICSGKFLLFKQIAGIKRNESQRI